MLTTFGKCSCPILWVCKFFVVVSGNLSSSTNGLVFGMASIEMILVNQHLFVDYKRGAVNYFLYSFSILHDFNELSYLLRILCLIINLRVKFNSDCVVTRNW
ncbi:hypothetical protein VNO78_02911 [Psophocarpus tetragonolobus]|uniref:Uncharacterized protein n=1 Tax=Psophocarpus tetragonolobus TaxID=3891 RepID=A0AAN9SZH4_PSOTE